MDAARVRREIVDWLRDRVREAGAGGLVVGISGGLDSAVVAGLAKEAFPDAALGVWMPCHSAAQDAEDAALVAAAFDIPLVTVDLTGVFDRLAAECRAALGRGEPAGTPRLRMAEANVKPRLRTAVLHFAARALGYLVAGTTNRSELAVGYFTKFADNGVDLLPIGDLVKAEVRALARELGVPPRIVEKAPSAGLWEGQTDEEELGVTYADLDRFLLAGEASPEVKERVERMMRQSEHKRRLPPIAKITRTNGV
ncbi:MAG: NAD(+) synthase [Clostridia bacterium]|nr:NAD(+) synthase [Bacillota bacterium]MBO2521011.1 NAD(+) synthase [Bacillota bacterium]